MPENKQSGRTIRGSMPTKTGSYAGATAPQLHGKGSNKTADFIRDIDPQDPGAQAFYREALNDIPHPLEAGKTLTYGQLQQLMNGPQQGAALEAYRAANRLSKTPTPEAYQRAVFEAGRKQLMERGATNPGAYAFPGAAVEALRAPTTARLIRTGNFASPNQPGQVVTQPMLAQRAAEMPAEDAIMAAPGMPVRLVRPAARPAPSPRTIAGSLASR